MEEAALRPLIYPLDCIVVCLDAGAVVLESSSRGYDLP